MKTIFKSALVALLLAFCTIPSVHAAGSDNTTAMVVGRIQTTAAGVTYVRPVGNGPWGGSNCQPTFVYMSKNIDGYEQIMALLLASKLNNTPIYFFGTCQPSGGYFLLDYAILT